MTVHSHPARAEPRQPRGGCATKTPRHSDEPKFHHFLPCVSVPLCGELNRNDTVAEVDRGLRTRFPRAKLAARGRDARVHLSVPFVSQGNCASTASLRFRVQSRPQAVTPAHGSPFLRMLRPWLFVGFTGHRKLDDPALITRAVRDALQRLAARTHAPLAA